MKTYLFKTSATMKDYNSNNWWIDENIVSDMYIQAENVKEALQQYRERVEKQDYISISDNALKEKSPMYIDTKEGETKQVGYVITGKMDFETDQKGWKQQYIDLWVNIETLIDTEF